MKKHIFTILFLVTLLITPVLAEVDVKCIGGAEGEKCGQTGTSSVDLIANLRAQIATLTAQLNQLLAEKNNGESCHTFGSDLKFGDIGSEIRHLHRLLFSNLTGNHENGLTETFNEIVTKEAKQFQSKYGIPSTGYVGPLTRAKLNELYGCNKKVFITPESLPNAGLPKEYAPNGSPAGNFYSAHLKAHGFATSSILSWSVKSGALPTGLNIHKSIPPARPGNETISLLPLPESYYVQSEADISGWPTIAGTYNFTVQVTDGTQTATQNYTLVVKEKETATSAITVTSPNGGEVWMASSTEDIKWTWVGAKRTDKVDIYLIQDWSCPPGLACAAVMPEPILLDKNISARATYHWFVGSEINSNAITIPLGKYRVQVCPAGKEVWSNDCDSSDQLFSINLPLINDAL